MRSLLLVLFFVPLISFAQTYDDEQIILYEDYLNKGILKQESGNYYGAIADLTKALEIDPDSYHAYSIRAISKQELGDYSGSIADHTKAIETVESNFRGIDIESVNSFKRTFLVSVYSSRAYSKSRLKDYYGTISDYTKVIELNHPNGKSAYAMRGYAKGLLGDSKGACEDFKKGANLGDTLAAQLLQQRCN